jgi:hypothetical protein
MSYNNGAGYTIAADLRIGDRVRFDGSNEPLEVRSISHVATTVDASQYKTIATLRIGDDIFEAELDPQDTLNLVPSREARALDILERRARNG